MTDYTTSAAAVAGAMNAVYENKQTNKKNDISGDFSSDNESYPTVKAVKDIMPTKTSDLTNDGSNSSDSLVYVETSSTGGLIKNDGTIDTNTYSTTSHTHGQVTSDGKITSTAVTVASGDNIVITDASDSSKVKRVANLLASHIKDSTAHTNIGSSANATQATINTNIDTALGNKISKSSTSGLVKNDGSIDTNTYITSSSLPTKTSDLTNDGADGTNVYVATNDSRLSDARTPTSHNQASSTITDTNTYSNIGNSAQTQESINSAINSKLGELVNINFVTVVTELPTASSSTMGKIYLVPISGSGTNNYAEYITVKDGSNYSWEKFGEVSGSGLSVDWSDITNKPSSFTPSSHTHGNITNDGKVGTASGKPLITTTGGAVTAGAFGTSSGQFAEGNHTHSTYTTTSDVASEIQSFATALASAINPSS